MSGGLKRLGRMVNGIQKYERKRFRRGYGFLVEYRGPDGRKRTKLGFEYRADAERWLTETKRAMQRGEWLAPELSQETVGELVERWLNGPASLNKAATIYKYRGLYRNHIAPRWADVTIGNVIHSDVQEWVAERAHVVGAGTVRDALSVFRQSLDMAVKDRHILTNPCVGVKVPPVKVEKPRRYLTMEQLMKLAEQAGKRRNADYSTLVLFMGTTGLRFGEAAGLRVGDIDFDSCLVNVHENAVWVGSQLRVDTLKNGDDRVVPFPRSLLSERLRARCAGKDSKALVFERPGAINDGTALTQADYMRNPDPHDGWFEYSVRDAGLPRMTLHDLRHTAVSLAVSSGANIKAVQRIAGHKSATMTLDTYADLFASDMADVAARLDSMAEKITPK